MEDSKVTAEEIPKRLPYHYIKSNYFRVIKVDGGIGGFTPRGDIHLTLFSERLPIPDLVEHQITPDGQLGPVARVSSKSGLVREIEANIVLTPEAARQIADWLIRNANDVEAVFRQSQHAETASNPPPVEDNR